MRKEALAILSGYIKAQKEEIERLFKEIETTEPVNKEKAIYVAYYLHNLYCAFEDLFTEIARTFENRIDDPSRYHRELLRRMAIEVPSIRPPVLSRESYNLLDELRKFRHVFRHAYMYDIETDRIKELKQKLLSGYAVIMEDIRTFESFVQKEIG